MTPLDETTLEREPARATVLTQGEFRAPYPFVRDVHTWIDPPISGDMEEPWIERSTPCWKPGVRSEPVYDDFRMVADGLGEIILTEISRHKPPGFPERVFFKRRWRDPEGKEFGKSRCHIATAQKFRRLCAGYGHDFAISPEEAP